MTLISFEVSIDVLNYFLNSLFIFLTPTTETEVSGIIKRLDVSKGPGTDGNSGRIILNSIVVLALIPTHALIRNLSKISRNCRRL